MSGTRTMGKAIKLTLCGILTAITLFVRISPLNQPLKANGE